MIKQEYHSSACRWARHFITEILQDTPFANRWNFIFQKSNSGNTYEWVVFFVDDSRKIVSPGHVKAYHGCPLSVATAILQEGFKIGESQSIWFCTYGSCGHGRNNALERCTIARGWHEGKIPCLWSLPVVISFHVSNLWIGSGGHKSVGGSGEHNSAIKRFSRDVNPNTRLAEGVMYPLHSWKSIELHINLRYYQNYSAWDLYWQGPSVRQLLKDGYLILCGCKHKKPWKFSHISCGAIENHNEAVQKQWYKSGKGYFYCPICKEHRTGSKPSQYLIPDSASFGMRA